MAETIPILISVVIPTYRRAEQLCRCLDALALPLHQSLAGAYEVIVSDDATTDPVRSTLQSRYPWVKWVDGPHRGPAANRNSGARHALGQWLLFTDDDCVPSASWLEAFAERARLRSSDLLEGRTLSPATPDHPLNKYVDNPDGGNFWSCNLAVNREVFLSLGGFDEDFLDAGFEDMEFVHRFRSHGYSAEFVKSAVIVHPVRRLTLVGVTRQVLMHRWKILYELKIATDGSWVYKNTAPVWFGYYYTLNLLRTTWHLIVRRDKARWKSKAFDNCWRWLTLPVMLPYLMCWTWRFQNQLRRQARMRCL